MVVGEGLEEEDTPGDCEGVVDVIDVAIGVGENVGNPVGLFVGVGAETEGK
jgi:hypothetical protein